MKSSIDLTKPKLEEAKKIIGQISGATEGNKEEGEEDNDQFTINLGLNTQYPQVEYIDPTIIKLGLERAIDDLTHFQLCEALPVMLSSNQSDEIPPAIAEQIKIWSDVGAASAGSLTLSTNIRSTMTAFYDYFKSEHGLDLESMKPNSAFAENMVSHSTNTEICCYEMQLFCKYIAILSQKPLEVQKIFFDTFPPKKREDIACLGGTGSRMSDLTDQLQVSKEDGPFMETHKLLS